MKGPIKTLILELPDIGPGELCQILYSIYLCVISMLEMNRERKMKRKSKVACQQLEKLPSSSSRDRKFSFTIKMGNPTGYSKL